MYHCARSIRARRVYRMPLYSTGVELGHKSEVEQGVAIRGEHCKTA
jgi:hypothetical protein